MILPILFLVITAFPLGTAKETAYVKGVSFDFNNCKNGPDEKCTKWFQDTFHDRHDKPITDEDISNLIGQFKSDDGSVVTAFDGQQVGNTKYSAYLTAVKNWPTIITQKINMGASNKCNITISMLAPSGGKHCGNQFTGKFQQCEESNDFGVHAIPNDKYKLVDKDPYNFDIGFNMGIRTNTESTVTTSVEALKCKRLCIGLMKSYYHNIFNFHLHLKDCENGCMQRLYYGNITCSAFDMTTDYRIKIGENLAFRKEYINNMGCFYSQFTSCSEACDHVKSRHGANNCAWSGGNYNNYDAQCCLGCDKFESNQDLSGCIQWAANKMNSNFHWRVNWGNMYYNTLRGCWLAAALTTNTALEFDDCSVQKSTATSPQALGTKCMPPGSSCTGYYSDENCEGRDILCASGDEYLCQWMASSTVDPSMHWPYNGCKWNEAANACEKCTDCIQNTVTTAPFWYLRSSELDINQEDNMIFTDPTNKWKTFNLEYDFCARSIILSVNGNEFKKYSYTNYDPCINFLDGMYFQLYQNTGHPDIYMGGFIGNIHVQWESSKPHLSSKYLYDCTTTKEQQALVPTIKDYDSETEILTLEFQGPFFGQTCNAAFQFMEVKHDCACNCNSEVIIGDITQNKFSQVKFIFDNSISNECTLGLYAKHEGRASELVYSVVISPVLWLGPIESSLNVNKMEIRKSKIYVPIKVKINSKLELCTDRSINCATSDSIPTLSVKKGETFYLKHICEDCPIGTEMKSLNQSYWDIDGLQNYIDITKYVTEKKFNGKEAIYELHLPFEAIESKIIIITNAKVEFNQKQRRHLLSDSTNKKAASQTIIIEKEINITESNNLIIYGLFVFFALSAMAMMFIFMYKMKEKTRIEQDVREEVEEVPVVQFISVQEAEEVPVAEPIDGPNQQGGVEKKHAKSVYAHAGV